MCLNPINITNPTRYVSLYQAQLMKMQVRCNKCAECLKAIQSEWYFRSYYHTRATLMSGGYMMMDCLTYRNSDLPHISDFIDIKQYGVQDYMCFNYKHVRDFIKLLRIRLKRLGYKSKRVFTYFVTSEYGTDENFTHRPHYHILLFVHDVRLNPFVLSQLISDCWPYGRTDGIRYHNRLYVMQHIYGWKSNDDMQAITKVTNYVSKYVTKDSTYQFVIDRRLFAAKGMMTEDDYKTLYRQMSMFHRQSQGFGLDYLNIITSAEYEDMLETCEMQMPDPKFVHRRIKLPMYYIRKLFYVQCKDITYPSLVYREQGDKIIRKYWRLTDYGKEWKSKFLKKSIDNLAASFYDVTLNMQDDERVLLSRLLDGRTLRDYAVYKLLYKGRLMNGFGSLDEDVMIKHIVEYDTPYIDDNRLYRFKSKYPLFPNNDIITDKDINYIVYYAEDAYKRDSIFKSYFLSQRGYEINQIGNYVDTTQYIEKNVYNQNSYLSFRNFDKISSLFESVNQRLKSHSQATFDHITNLKHRYKVMKGGVYYE